MHIDEIYMRLESLKHLRDMPKLKRLKDKIEAELAEIQEKISPKEDEQSPATVEPEVEAVDPPDHLPPEPEEPDLGEALRKV